MKSKRKSRLRNWLLGILAIIVIAFIAFWPTNYFIESPGEAVRVVQFINAKGKKPDKF